MIILRKTTEYFNCLLTTNDKKAQQQRKISNHEYKKMQVQKDQQLKFIAELSEKNSVNQTEKPAVNRIAL